MIATENLERTEQFSLLLVDDQEIQLTLLARYFASDPRLTIATARSGAEALAKFKESRLPIDLVLTDLRMEEVDGLEVLRKIKRWAPTTKVIILTAYSEVGPAIEAIRNRADDYILKPFDVDELRYRLSKCLERIRFERRIKGYESLLPVCCQCKRIRDDSGREPGTGDWYDLERYLQAKARINVTHTYCPECFNEFEADLDSYREA